jgi:hypothetical protein
MNPEELLRQLDEAVVSGMSREKAEGLIKKVSGGAFSSRADLEAAVAQAQVERARAAAAAPPPPVDPRAPRPKSEQGGLGGLSDLGRLIFQGATGSFGDELVGLAAGVIPGGKTRAEATQASRDRLARLRAEKPVASTMAEVLGSLAPTGLAARGAQAVGLLGRSAPLTGAMTGRAAGVADRVGAVTRNLLGKPAVASSARIADRATPFRESARAAARGVGAGAAEGAVYGAGAAEGGLSERIRGATTGAAIGGAAGGAVSGALTGLPIAARTFTRTRDAGERLADDLIGVSGGRPSPSVMAEQNKLRRADLVKASTATVEDPAVLDAIVSNKVLRDQVEESVPALVDDIKRLDEGKSGRPISVRQIDDIRQGLESRIQTLTAENAAQVGPELKKVMDAWDALDGVVTPALEKQGAGKVAASLRQLSTDMMGLQAGRRVWGAAASADDIRMALQSVPEGSRQFVRDGMVAEALSDLEELAGTYTRPSSAARGLFEAGRGREEKIRMLFPTTAQADEFIELVRREGVTTKTGQKIYTAIQAIAFLYGGSSILSGLLFE